MAHHHFTDYQFDSAPQKTFILAKSLDSFMTRNKREIEFGTSSAVHLVHVYCCREWSIAMKIGGELIMQWKLTEV